ncbi:hypothetical protein SRIMM317S_03206 [Streptomyces rimosus subsp. rimosus]
MTPRVRVSALGRAATAEDVANLTRATGLSRFPVYRGGLDEVVGMVHIKDVLAGRPSDERLRHPGRRAGSPTAAPGAGDTAGAAAAGAAARRTADGRGRRRVRRYGGRRHPGGHRRGTRRRGPRRARPGGGCPSWRRRARPRTAGPSLGGGRRRCRVDTLAPDRPGRAGRPVRDRWPDWSRTDTRARCPGRPATASSVAAAGGCGVRWSSPRHRAARVRMHADGRLPPPPPPTARGGRPGDVSCSCCVGLPYAGQVNAFFVGAEFAMISVRRSQIEPLAAEDGERRRRPGAVGPGARLPADAGGGPAGHHRVLPWCSARSPNPPSPASWSPSSTRSRVPARSWCTRSRLRPRAGRGDVPAHRSSARWCRRTSRWPRRRRPRCCWGRRAWSRFARALRPVIVAIGACANALLRLFRVEADGRGRGGLHRRTARPARRGLAGRPGCWPTRREQERLRDALELGQPSGRRRAPGAGDRGGDGSVRRSPRDRRRGTGRDRRLLPLPGVRAGGASWATCTSRTRSTPRRAICRSRCPRCGRSRAYGPRRRWTTS